MQIGDRVTVEFSQTFVQGKILGTPPTRGAQALYKVESPELPSPQWFTADHIFPPLPSPQLDT